MKADQLIIDSLVGMWVRRGRGYNAHYKRVFFNLKYGLAQHIEKKWFCMYYGEILYVQALIHLTSKHFVISCVEWC